MQTHRDGRTKNVVITGFGPFREHAVNPSWEAVKDERLTIQRDNVNLIKQQVEVAYEEVDKLVETMWAKYEPILMVHVGLAAHESAIRIEQRARLGPFIHNDVRRDAPHRELRDYGPGEGSIEEQTIRHEYYCKPCSFDCKTSCFDVDQVCAKLNATNNCRLQFKRSDDAGLYVCEYIYQKSLRICDRTVFIHVPDTQNFALEDIIQAVRCALEELVDQALLLTLGGA